MPFASLKVARMLSHSLRGWVSFAKNAPQNLERVLCRSLRRLNLATVGIDHGEVAEAQSEMRLVFGTVRSENVARMLHAGLGVGQSALSFEN
jgi:hypothetical protein